MFTSVTQELLMRPMAVAPATVSQAVKKLCETISPGMEPEFVQIVPAADAIPQECFRNVAAAVKRHGGEMLLGWSIVEWPDVFAEGEFHAVWASPNGLLDVTPQEGAGSRGLFLRDPAATYDFENPKRTMNRKFALNQLPETKRWIIATNSYHHRLEQCSVGSKFVFGAADQAALAQLREKLLDEKCDLLLALTDTTTVNDACICGSGRKFKKCCRSHFE